MEYDSCLYLGVTKQEMSKLWINKLYYNLLVPKLKRIKIHYTGTDSFFLLSFIYGEIEREHFDRSNLDVLVRTDKNYLVSSNMSLVVLLTKIL